MFDLMMALDEKSGDHLIIMNVCAKFYGSPSNGYWDISLKTTNVNLMVALEGRSGDQQSH